MTKKSRGASAVASGKLAEREACVRLSGKKPRKAGVRGGTGMYTQGAYSGLGGASMDLTLYAGPRINGRLPVEPVLIESYVSGRAVGESNDVLKKAKHQAMNNEPVILKSPLRMVYIHQKGNSYDDDWLLFPDEQSMRQCTVGTVLGVEVKSYKAWPKWVERVDRPTILPDGWIMVPLKQMRYNPIIEFGRSTYDRARMAVGTTGLIYAASSLLKQRNYALSFLIGFSLYAIISRYKPTLSRTATLIVVIGIVLAVVFDLGT